MVLRDCLVFSRVSIEFTMKWLSCSNGSLSGKKSRLRKLEQVDKWGFCLKAAMIAANRRDHEQTTAPEPQPSFQDEGGACRRQGRPDDSSSGRALRCPPNQVTAGKARREGGASDVFGAGSPATAAPAVDVKSLHAKIGELTLENDFLEGALTKAGLLSAKR